TASQVKLQTTWNTNAKPATCSSREKQNGSILCKQHCLWPGKPFPLLDPANRHRRKRQFVRSAVRPDNFTPAIHTRSFDIAELRRTPGGPHPGRPSWVRRHG